MVIMVHAIGEIIVVDNDESPNLDQDAYEEDDVLHGDDVHDVMKIMTLKMIVTMNSMMLKTISIKRMMILVRLMMLNADYDTNSSSGCVASWPG